MLPNESPDLDFEYDDTDRYEVEISELYSYTEEPEFFLNKRCYDEMEDQFMTKPWTKQTKEERKVHVLRLLNATDVSDHDKRMHSVRSILYLCQGCFGECSTEEEQQKWTQENVYLLYECGTFSAFCELLSMEIENGTAASSALRKPAVSLADSTDLRILLNVMYVMVETLRRGVEGDCEDWQRLRENFLQELVQPVSDNESLALVLFGMVTKFCSGNAPHFPMKKALLLLWKVLLCTLGGLHNMYEVKNEKRAHLNLPPLTEDSHEVCKHLRASSPPNSCTDLIEQQQPRRSFRSSKKPDFLKQSGIEDPFTDGGGNEEDDMTASDEEIPPTPPRPSTPQPIKGLPWTPKVRKKDIEVFLEHTRAKFVGFQVKNDDQSLAGLPHPIHEGVRVLRQHLYVSMCEMQVDEEEELSRNPLSKQEDEVIESPVELLYQAMLPNLPQFMIALLKILLAAAPTSKAKTDSINILADVLPEEMPTTVLQSMKLGIDVNRHKEVIVKAIAALLLLLLKHFKLNHIYQFEYISQHLVFANCIPLVLKFFNQNINSYVTAKNSIPLIDFPHNVIGEQADLTAENLETGDNQCFCWRNLFSCINLLRILNKLTKWKHSRTMMLVVFKSAPILKRALKVKHAMMQVYILKLLKMQTKYLGRQWRKSNMKTMSAIYQKVRHRLTDDWAFGNDMDARPWDFQAEECALRSCVDRFNNRRYSTECTEMDFEPVDNCFLSVLGQEVELSDEFKMNYEKWLDIEVFSNQVDWDQMVNE
ncbi:hypothetical protein CAPTEDRAFT_164543 [Capitella teleta]|uniref:Far11/STRP C-terminal domain-containing protein n=1 Tax=Capitella teleta TaxID=283909 RepID=R7VEB9_CAPTE|nr:hypothetical protein CAPTEDRAFT_164543 [Capitella teleta]|eukprot:ELU17163.1 hypothetical protein CAPTEDRAFT_164543 [Capitella teleta]